MLCHLLMCKLEMLTPPLQGCGIEQKKFKNIDLKIMFKGNHSVKGGRKAGAHICIKSHPVTKSEL